MEIRGTSTDGKRSTDNSRRATAPKSITARVMTVTAIGRETDQRMSAFIERQAPRGSELWPRTWLLRPRSAQALRRSTRLLQTSRRAPRAPRTILAAAPLWLSPARRLQSAPPQRLVHHDRGRARA